MKNTVKKNINLDGQEILLFCAQNSEYMDISNIINKSYDKRTTFNYSFFNFGDYFNKVMNSKANYADLSSEGVYCLPEKSKLETQFNVIKEYSNGEFKLTYDFSKKVLKAFKNIYVELNTHFSWTNDEYFIVPLKGGGFIINLFELNNKKVFQVEAKRVPLKKIGDLGLGMNLGTEALEMSNQFMNEINDKEIVFIEVCIASGMTTIGFLLDLYFKGIKTKKIKVFTAASSIQGINLVRKVATQLNMNIEFYTGKLIENVSDFYDVSQDSIIYADGNFVVKSPENAYKIVHGI